MKTKARRARIFALYLGIGALAWLGFTAVRSRRLLKNGAQIEAQSQSFKRDYFVGDAKATPLLYVAMGDSTAAGWGAAQLQNSYPFRVAEDVAARGYHVHVFNLAVGGARWNDVRRGQLPQLKRLKPDMVSLSVGANDAIHFTPQTEVERDMRSVMAALQSSGARTVLLANTPDVALAPALPLPLSLAAGRRARELNLLLNRIWRESKPKDVVRVVDLFRFGKLNYQKDPQLYAADLFHPSAHGYDVWAKIFAAENEKAGGF